MSMRETLQRWNLVRNEIGAEPVWVEVRFQFIDPEAGVVATIDWNNREAVRSFAAYSDACLRSGVRVTTQRVRADGSPWAKNLDDPMKQERNRWRNLCNRLHNALRCANNCFHGDPESQRVIDEALDAYAKASKAKDKPTLERTQAAVILGEMKEGK